jgi:uncharacterized membrane protein YeaQ/YmgE (transglycosylase-associated protein family)
MTLKSFIMFLVVGLVAGWLAGLVLKHRGIGWLGYLIIGVLGALLGGFLFDLLGLSAHGFIGSLIMATGGAIVLLMLLGLIKKR